MHKTALPKEQLFNHPSKSDRLAGTTTEEIGVLANRDYPAECYLINGIIGHIPSGALRSRSSYMWFTGNIRKSRLRSCKKIPTEERRSLRIRRNNHQ